jgi:cytochrome c oxidase subunit 4
MSHIAPKSLYITIFAALIVGTVLTVAVTYVDLGPANLLVAMAVAVTKASLVVLFFMHAKYSERLVRVSILSAIIFLGFLFAFGFADYFTRGAIGVALQR